MAMLAEPRRKQKIINLRAKNNAWSNDTNKFGQRMLEKMGWSAGKGLGAKENGIVEHVVAKYKNDDRGLGFEDKNDQWTKHEDDFNALLANLSNGDTKEEKLHSGISLEHKSKKSKARVHYHKFTRGKDLTRYSEKDLANIFGKKSLKPEEKVDEPLPADVENTEQIFTEKGSMEDYFKNKLAAFKSKSNLSLSDKVENEESDFVFKGFAGTGSDEDEEQNGHQGFGFQSFSFYDKSENHVQNTNKENDSAVVEEDKQKKEKKKKKKQQDLEIETIEIDCDNEIENKKKKKKKDKTVNTDHEIVDLSVEEQKEDKKSKKKKHQESDVIFIEDDQPKRKKSKKKDNTNEIQEIEEVAIQEEFIPKKKKKKKNKEIEN